MTFIAASHLSWQFLLSYQPIPLPATVVININMDAAVLYTPPLWVHLKTKRRVAEWHESVVSGKGSRNRSHCLYCGFSFKTGQFSTSVKYKNPFFVWFRSKLKQQKKKKHNKHIGYTTRGGKHVALMIWVNGPFKFVSFVGVEQTVLSDLWAGLRCGETVLLLASLGTKRVSCSVWSCPEESPFCLQPSHFSLAPGTQDI